MFYYNRVLFPMELHIVFCKTYKIVVVNRIVSPIKISQSDTIMKTAKKKI